MRNNFPQRKDLKVYIRGRLWSTFKSFVGIYFATYPKMVLINVDQCIIRDIVLAVGSKLKNFNHSSMHSFSCKFLRLSNFDFFTVDAFEVFKMQNDLMIWGVFSEQMASYLVTPELHSRIEASPQKAFATTRQWMTPFLLLLSLFLPWKMIIFHQPWIDNIGI